jgi:hypothetical protein
VGQTLFAGELEFVHPTKGEMMRFTADFPENYRKIIENCERKATDGAFDNILLVSDLDGLFLTMMETCGKKALRRRIISSRTADFLPCHRRNR